VGAACAAVLLAAAAAAIERAAESVNSGGAPSASVSYRAHDSVGQHAIGPLGQSATLRIHDGFWLGLPGINVPVEGIVYAALTDQGVVAVRWTVASLADVVGFNVYRSPEEPCDYSLLTPEPLPPSSPGLYEDATTWPGTTFWYEVRALLADGTEETVTGSPASVATTGTLLLALYAPRPNPSAGPTTLRFDVPQHSGPVSVVIYNILGRRVRSLVSGPLERGRHERTWDGLDDAGHPVAAGVYFGRLAVGGSHDDEKLLIVR